MTALERYLADCENKRRRLRDRPSNEVLDEIRGLLAQQDEDDRAPSRRDATGKGRSETSGSANAAAASA